MRKTLALIAALLAAALAGCAEYPFMPEKGPDPQRPRVSTDGRTIAVDQELLLFRQGREPVQVSWSLPADGPWRFVPERGIVIEGRLTEELTRGERPAVLLAKQDEIVNCAADERRITYTCTNKRSRFGIYKYTIRITDGNRIIERDPLISNW